jgi:hypothetical protein
LLLLALLLLLLLQNHCCAARIARLLPCYLKQLPHALRTHRLPNY